MNENTVTITIKLEAPGLSLSSFAWSDQREFIDAFLAAFATLPGGAGPTAVALEGMERGSVISRVRAPAGAAQAARILAKGPTRRWTRDQRTRAQPLYDFVRGREADLSIGQRVLHPVRVPDDSGHWSVREIAELRGKVVMAGGRNMRLRLDFDGDGLVVCDASPDIVKALGGLLDQSVYADGVTTRDTATGALLHMVITGWRQAPPRRAAPAVLADIDALLGDDLNGLDWMAFLRQEPA